MKLNSYIGLRAIGFVITEGSKVIKAGIKRVNISFDNYYEFIAGNPVTKRINKRLKAQARRNLWRYKSRRDNLLRLLKKEFNCEPQNLSREENLRLRIKGCTSKLSLQELVNVLAQLQNKRGYKSLRGVSDNDASDYLKKIEEHENNIKQYPCVAAYLLTLESSKDVIITRKTYENEFHQIMSKQDIDTILAKRIFDVIYYQRPLKKPKKSTCKCEKNRSVCHASNPDYQTFRILRDVMNIEIFDLEKNQIEIPFELRKKWFEKCNAGANLTKASCLKDLNIKKPSNYNWFSGKAIAGNPIEKAFSDLNITSDRTELWQDLYSATDNEMLANFLIKKYGFSNAVVSELLDLDLNKLGWSEFSLKAVKKLYSEMLKGKTLKNAIIDIYGKFDKKEIALRNVVLEQHFDSYKALVSNLQQKYNITEFQFEIDNLLKQGNKGRKSIAQSKRKEDKFNAANSDLSHYDRIKLQLWNESGGISPYEPEKVIDKKELFTDAYNLDHIVPKSKLYERSLANQVLCPTHLNLQKGRMTGIEFAEKLGIKEKYIEAAAKFPESKQKFLLMSESEIPENYISARQNSDYNTKCFATIGNAVNIPNKLINRYMNHFGVNLYGENDARNVLCKAWTLANMSQETVNYFDKIKQYSENNESVSVYNLSAEIDKIDFENAIVFMPRLKYARRTKYGFTPRFALHQESVFGLRKKVERNAKGNLVTTNLFKIRQPVSKLTPPMVLKIMDNVIRKKIQDRIAEKGNHEDGILSLVENPVLFNNKPVFRVSVAQKAEKIFALHSTDGKGRTGKYNEFEQKTDYVFSEKNYCLNFKRNEKGGLIKESISLIEYIKAINEGKDLGIKFCVQENSTFEFDGKLYYSIGASDRIVLRSIYSLNASEPIKLNNAELLRLNKVEISQTCEIIKKYAIEDCI